MNKLIIIPFMVLNCCIHIPPVEDITNSDEVNFVHDQINNRMARKSCNFDYERILRVSEDIMAQVCPKGADACINHWEHTIYVSSYDNYRLCRQLVHEMLHSCGYLSETSSVIERAPIEICQIELLKQSLIQGRSLWPK